MSPARTPTAGTTRTRWHGALTLLTIACLGAGCAKSAPTAMAPANGVHSLARGGASIFARRVREIVQDSARWARLRDSVWSPDIANPPPPVDFAREMLLLVAEPHVGDGDSIVIERVRPLVNRLEVRATIYLQCAPLNVVRTPWHVVYIPRTPLPVMVSHRIAVARTCDPIPPPKTVTIRATPAR
jgi:hypothetical protein